MAHIRILARSANEGRRWASLAIRASVIFLLLGCRSERDARVIVYCAHDREFTDELLKDFEKQSGIKVVVRYDTEANKSVGLYEDLIRETEHPRCDVHWNNEILATIRLQKRGLLAPYESPASAPFPEIYKAKDHTWTAFAARARVLLINTERVSKDAEPSRLEDLTKPEWKGRIGMAKPLFGTTASQAACLFEAWGDEPARAFYSGLHANNVQIVPGNKQAAQGVSAGQFDLALTDTDDAVAEIEAGKPVRMIFPDAKASPKSRRGVLFIPNTLALIRGCPNPEAGKHLIDFLLRPEIEAQLARSASRQIPLNPQVKLGNVPHIQTPQSVQALAVDFELAAEKWHESQQFLMREFALR